MAVTVGVGVAAGGDGLGRLPDGRVLFVEGALPGETVEVAIVSARRDHARGRATRVIEPAPARVSPACPQVAAGCGGCGWAHVDAVAQLDLAERVVVDALRRIGRVRDLPVMLSSRRVGAAGYRTTVTMAVAAGGHLAYHRRHASGLVPVDTCRVAHPLVEELIATVRAPGWEAVTLRVGVSGGERLVVVESTPRAASARGRRARRPQPSRRPAGRGGSIVAPGDAVVVRPGQHGSISEEVAGRRWRVSARSFFQAGPGAAALLVDAVDAAVGDALGAGEHLVDAYAGVGLLGGVVAERRQARLTVVESGRSALSDARRNLADLDATVVAGEIGQWVPERAEVVIADPARTGLGRPGVGALAATGARRVVLASCDPASLARDTALLAGVGYQLAAVEVLGVFPDTVHIETVSRFERVDSRA